MNDLNTAEEMTALSVYVGTLDRPGGGRSRKSSLVQSGLQMTVPRQEEAQFETTGRRKAHLAMKRAMDVVLSGMALLALAPLFLIVSIAIKLTSAGPVFFRQEREGYLGTSFVVFKFRSMRTDACDLSGISQTVRNDPRVTLVGKFLRQTSIDELPQLINVFLGQMSLVGPRPHVSNMVAAGMPYDKLVPYYHRRLDMVPGLTGWAQANGLRGETKRADLARARINHDIAYIQNFSIWLDIKIIFLTLKREFFGGSGY